MQQQYRERFTAMVDELRVHPRLSVTHFWAGPPMNDLAIDQAERTANVSVFPAVRAFYRQCNGLQLRWITKANPYRTSEDEQFMSVRADYLQGDEKTAEGVVNILTLDACLEAMGDDEENLRHFDDCSAQGSVVFTVHEGVLSRTLCMGDDHDAHWNSTVIDFESYLELVLQYRGSIRARETALHSDGGTVRIEPGNVRSIESLLVLR